MKSLPHRQSDGTGLCQSRRESGYRWTPREKEGTGVAAQITESGGAAAFFALTWLRTTTSRTRSTLFNQPTVVLMWPFDETQASNSRLAQSNH